MTKRMGMKKAQGKKKAMEPCVREALVDSSAEALGVSRSDGGRN